MIHVIGVTNENTVVRQPALADEELARFKWVWVDFAEPDEEEVKYLIDTFHFHPVAVETCLTGLQRPKLDHYDHYTFYVTHMLKEVNREIKKQKVNFFVGDAFIVTVHQQPANPVNQVCERLTAQANVANWDTYTVFYSILNRMVDDYFSLIEQMEDDLENMEDNTKHKKMNDLMMELFDTRKMLLHIRHSVSPMQDMLYQMLYAAPLVGDRHRRKYFSHIRDRLLKLSEMVTSCRENTADIRDSYLSLNSYQTNKVMTILTIVASIFTPLTFIAGVYGMNFTNMPELTWSYGYVFVLLFMGIIGGAMCLWFWKKGWFK